MFICDCILPTKYSQNILSRVIGLGVPIKYSYLAQELQILSCMRGCIVLPKSERLLAPWILIVDVIW